MGCICFLVVLTPLPPLPNLGAIHYAKVGETLAVSGLPTLREEQALHPPAPSPIKGEGEPETLSPRPFWERGTQGVRAI